MCADNTCVYACSVEQCVVRSTICIDSHQLAPLRIESRDLHKGMSEHKATLKSERGAGEQRVRRSRPQTVSCVLLTDGLTRESAEWFAAARQLCDELVVFIDTKRASAESHAHAHRIATCVIETEGKGFIEAHLEEMFRACRSDWILRLDSDESLGAAWASGEWREQLQNDEFTHFTLPRRWLHPGGGFIANAPWWPDLQVRLIRNDPQLIKFPAWPHGVTHVRGRGGNLASVRIDHHVLCQASRAEREAKVERYEQLRPGGSLSFYYLFEDYSPPTLPLAADLKKQEPPMQALADREVKSVSLTVSMVPEQVNAGESFWTALRLTNNTSKALCSGSPAPVHLAYHWRDQASQALVTFDGVRTVVDPAVGAGAREYRFAIVTAPEAPGAYILDLTLVQAGVRWFEDANPSVLCSRNVSVSGTPPSLQRMRSTTRCKPERSKTNGG